MTREIILPELGEGIKEGVIIGLLVSKNDMVTSSTILIEVETDKVTIEIPCDSEGLISEVHVKNGDKIKPGDLIVSLETNRIVTAGNVEQIAVSPALTITEDTNMANIPVIEKTQEVSVEPDNSRGQKKRPIIASPLARKLARELGIDIQDMENESGIGRISVQSIKDYVKNNKKVTETQPIHHSSPSLPLPDFEKFGVCSKVGMLGIAIATARNMSQSWNNIPHAWLQEKVDITQLEEKRKLHKKSFETYGVSFTITAILIKVLAAALKKHPIINSSIDIESNTIIYKDFINIGVAVDTERGLLVPVVKNADQLSFTEIAIKLNRFSNEGRERKTKMEDLEGATFTISNLGGIGTTGIFPLVSFPQVAILGVGGGTIEPAWIDNEWQPRLSMPLTLGFDHRVINGADGAKFLRTVKTFLEDPFALLL
jgi:pyruvate dehydrogenase E2 component (dihydrolipoamide acetyltransferase)